MDGVIYDGKTGAKNVPEPHIPQLDIEHVAAVHIERVGARARIERTWRSP